MKVLIPCLLVLLLAPAAGLGAGERQTLVKYNAWVDGLGCLTAGGKARVGGPGQTDRAFRFSLALLYPESFRMQGRMGAMAQIFDLSQNLDEWVLYLPQARQVVRGQDGEAGIDFLAPRDVMEALTPAPLPFDRVTSEGAWETVGSRLVVTLPPVREAPGLHRVVTLDRATGLPSRVEIRRHSRLEEPLLVVTYSAYEGDAPFPRNIRVEGKDGWARLEVRTVKTCQDLDPRRFRINIPYGTEELDPRSLNYDFLPPAEEEGS